jgi:squalene cyclase
MLRVWRVAGAFYGKWAVCFTYGAWFGVEGLLAAGEVSAIFHHNFPAVCGVVKSVWCTMFCVVSLVVCAQPASSPAIQRSNQFLLSQQRADGGWGESYLSCVTKEYQNIESNVVNTSWALLSLMRGQCSDAAAVRRGVTYLCSQQLQNGDWPQGAMSGIFNRTCGITYTAYRNVFPMWAVGVYINEYLPHVSK